MRISMLCCIVTLTISGRASVFAQAEPPFIGLQRQQQLASEDRSRLKFNLMIQTKQLDGDQVEEIVFILRQQKEMINLFAEYGLLSASQLEDEVQKITEVSEDEVLSILSDGQKTIWKEYAPFFPAEPVQHRAQPFSARLNRPD